MIFWKNHALLPKAYVSLEGKSMTLDTMAFVLGVLLIATGVLGGGLEVKELKLPRISGTARLGSAIVGLALVVLGLSINLKWIVSTEESKKSIVSTEESKTPIVSAEESKTPTPTENIKSFQAPTLDGLRLDACMEWSKRCGEEAATAWCKIQGYARAIEHPIENVGERG